MFCYYFIVLKFYSPLQKKKHVDKTVIFHNTFSPNLSIKHKTCFFCTLYFYRTTRFVIDFFILLDLSIYMAAFSNLKVSSKSMSF